LIACADLHGNCLDELIEPVDLVRLPRQLRQQAMVARF